MTVSPGDAVRFAENWTGEPHTVTMGSLVDSALPPANATAAQTQPAFQRLPVLLPNGPGNAHQNAAQPCFLTSGEPPASPNEACPKTTQPDFDGTQPYYNSGWLAPGDVFEVKLAADVKPGVYRYYCNLHGPPMSGKIIVRPKGAAIPTPSDVAKAATAERNTLASQARAAKRQADAGDFPIPGLKYLAGYANPHGATPALINEFIPATIHAKVREPVTWTFLGVHTISFNSPFTPGAFLTRARDGSVTVNEQAEAPAGGPGVTRTPSATTAGGAGIANTDGGTYAGSGPRSTGLVDSRPPILSSFTLTFTKPGTYSYTCLVHPGMGGVVEVA